MTKPLIRVLLVEDDAVDRMACRRALAREPGLRIFAFRSRIRPGGLQLAHEQKPDCVLLDYHLPDLNGLEFLAALADDRRRYCSIPVMMLTGTDNATIAVEAMKRGARDYLIKDIEHQYLEFLPAVIQRVLSERRMPSRKKTRGRKTRSRPRQNIARWSRPFPAIVYIAALDDTNRFLYVSSRIETLGFPPEQWLAQSRHPLAPKFTLMIGSARLKSAQTAGPPARRCAANTACLRLTEQFYGSGTKRASCGMNPGARCFSRVSWWTSPKANRSEEELRQHRYRLEDLVARRTDELAEVNDELRRDIAERKLIEAELTKAKTDAEKANLAKSEFLSSMSHELRSPLNVMLGFAQLMESSSPPPTSNQMTMLKEINSAGWYLLELINKILDLATIESGKLVVSPEPMSDDRCHARMQGDDRTASARARHPADLSPSGCASVCQSGSHPG